jgi:putative phosphotransacetylase
MRVNIAISNHHVHLKQSDLDILFGEPLEMDRPLTQEDEFASKFYVNIKGPKGEIDHVRVLGPVRPYTQVEIARTDAFKLGVNPPIRNSGMLEGSAPITIIGPKGTVELNEGCIMATRHIHMNQDDANKYGFTNDQIVSVRIDTVKGGVMDNVHIKITPKGVLEMQLDTDDGNGFMVEKGTTGEIIE